MGTRWLRLCLGADGLFQPSKICLEPVEGRHKGRHTFFFGFDDLTHDCGVVAAALHSRQFTLDEVGVYLYAMAFEHLAVVVIVREGRRK